MSFSRYAIEKKQVSTDRGVTWEDVTPSETRNGRLIGVSKTLLECEDMDCDLEMYGTIFVDEQVPSSVCTRPNMPEIGWSTYTTLLPSGIAKKIQFTNGMACCSDTWGSSTNVIVDEYHDAYETLKTATIENGWNPVRYYNSFQMNGREMWSQNFWCGVQTCYDITEFMPWVDTNGTFKMAYRVHYVREHCSEEWRLDDEFDPQFITIGERWNKIYEDAYKSVWQHQVATDIIYGAVVQDSIPFQVVWEDEGEPIEYFYETNIPSDVTLIEVVRGDGIAANKDATMLYPNIQIKFTPIVDEGISPSGYIIAKHYVYTQTYEGYSIAADDGGLTPNENNTVNAPKYTYGRVNNANECHFMTWYNGKLNNANISAIIMFDDADMMFPYKVYSNNGWSDEYLNASEYGFIKRDGTRLPVEYVYGKYTDTSGVTRNIAFDANATMSFPDDVESITFADSVTSIPSNCFNGNTTLTSVTMNNVTSIGNYAFQGTTNLESVTFSSNVAIGDWAFLNGGLRSVDLSNVSSLGQEVFSGCTRLANVTIGSSLTSIPDRTFGGNTSLTSLTIPDNVTSIGSDIVYGCTNLDTLDLGKGITNLGCYFLGNNVPLKNLILRYDEGVVDIGICCGYYCGCSAYHDTFFGSNYENLKIYVPDDLVNLYKSSWNNLHDTRCNGRDYSSQIYPLSEYE